MNMIDRPSPHNEEVEKALLGACLLYGNETFKKVKDRIKAPNWFHIGAHRKIYQSMLDVSVDGSIEPISVVDDLDRKDMLEAAGGAAYIVRLSGDMATDSNVDYHADIVEEDYHRRILIDTFRDAMFSLHDRNEDIYALLKSIASMQVSLSRGESATFIEDDIQSVVEEIEVAYSDPRNVIGVDAGLKFLNNVLSGYQPEDLVVLAARPSQGKTALALQSAKAAKVPVYFASREMSKRMLTMRMIASELGTGVHELRSGHISPVHFANLQSARKDVAKYPIIIDDQVKTPEGVVRNARKAKATHDIGLVVVDYLQLLSLEEKQTREREVATASATMKDLAKELGVPVLLLSQLSRANEVRADRPQLSDLRDSGAIEQDADVVIFLHEPKEKEADKDALSPDMTECIVAKQRNGPTGYKKIVFDKRCGIFSSTETGKLGG